MMKRKHTLSQTAEDKFSLLVQDNERTCRGGFHSFHMNAKLPGLPTRFDKNPGGREPHGVVGCRAERNVIRFQVLQLVHSAVVSCVAVEGCV